MVIVECLERLVSQAAPEYLEVIVADGSQDKTADLVESLFPTVRLLRFEERTTLAVLRGRAMALARGDIIAVLDPYSMVKRDWLKRLLEAHAEHANSAIGGAVNLYKAQDQGILTWAQYFNEYGMFMSPVQEGAIEILPGSNISYKRRLLFDGDKPRFTEFWKTFVNVGLDGTEDALWQSPDIVVELWKPVGFGSFLMTRFSHGRCYAGMRCEQASRSVRFMRMATAPLVPLVLQYRWTRRIWPKKLHRYHFVLSLPIQFLLFACWSVGEFTGYLSGAGRSCRKLYY